MADIIKKIAIIITFFFNYSFSQNIEKERFKLFKYSEIEIKSLDSYQSSWSQKKLLKDGLVIQNENYFKGKLRSIQNYVYDILGNEILEIQNYNPNNSKINDTIRKQKLVYNSKNILIQKEYSFNIVEKYSDFTKTGKPQLRESYNTKKDSLILCPFKEILTYDSKDNIIKEVKYEFTYSQELNNSKKILQIEKNEYKYDEYNNVIEIKRNYEPKIEFPIIMTGGRAQYEIENFRYAYNQDKLWTRMFWIVNGREKLIKKRKLKK